VLVVRCESSLVYFNIDYVGERLAALVSARGDEIRLIVLFLGAVPKVDLAGAEWLAEMHRTFAARGIDLRLADAHGDVRDALQRIGFEAQYGPLETGQTVDLVISQWERALLATGRA